MVNYAEIMEEIDQQEKEFQFTEFTSDTALKIGLFLVEKAKKENLKITIDINRNGHQLFHYSFDGTSPDNDIWVQRKIKLVNRLGRSSFYISNLLKRDGKTLEEYIELNHFEYAAHGGAFPMIIKNVGLVGTITVSGLEQSQDHKCVVDALRWYFENNKE